jgi:membrane-bound lytic murein transglycosylase B
MQYSWINRFLNLVAVASATIFLTPILSAHAAPDPAFTQFVVSLWPEAQAQGVSRATFDRETASLEPD